MRLDDGPSHSSPKTPDAILYLLPSDCAYGFCNPVSSRKLFHSESYIIPLGVSQSAQAKYGDIMLLVVRVVKNFKNSQLIKLVYLLFFAI